jgi:hypothetical protein
MDRSPHLSIREMHEVHARIGQPIFKKEILFEEKKKKHALNPENIFVKQKPKEKSKPVPKKKDKKAK